MQQDRPLDECFVIMPISSQDGYESGHFTGVYEDIIKPAILQAGLAPHRADESVNSHLIHVDMLRRLIESPMALCDLSARNPNVFYELGMRQAFDVPTVLVIDDATPMPFDIGGLRAVTYKKKMLYRDVVDAVGAISAAIKSTYEKRHDRNEVTSLVRLLDLISPQKSAATDLTDEARQEKRNQLLLEEIVSSIGSITKRQDSILDKLDDLQWENKRLSKLAEGSQAENRRQTESIRALEGLVSQTKPADRPNDG